MVKMMIATTLEQARQECTLAGSPGTKSVPPVVFSTAMTSPGWVSSKTGR